MAKKPKEQLIEERKQLVDGVIAAAKSGDVVEWVFLTKHIAFNGKDVHDGTSVLNGADPYTIRELAGGLVQADKNHVWRRGKLVPNADGTSFKAFGGIDGIYASDDRRVYCESKGGYEPIPDADSSTFKVLDFAYAQDATHVYCSGKRLADVGAKFLINPCGFLIGENVVYHYSYKLPIDPASFQIVNLEEKLKDTNPFIGEFTLEDCNGRYRFVATGFKQEFVRMSR